MVILNSVIIELDGAFLTEEKMNMVLSFSPKKRHGEKRTAFSGIVLSMNSGGQIKKPKRKEILKFVTLSTGEAFVNQGALTKYIGRSFWPVICATVHSIAPGNEDIESSQPNSLKRAVVYIDATSDAGLEFLKLDLKSVSIVALSKISFASKSNMKSQPGPIFFFSGQSEPRKYFPQSLK